MKSKLSFLFIVITLVVSQAFSQQIIIDESYDDWSTVNPLYVDHIDDGSFLGIDFINLWMSNDDEYLYISFDLKTDIILQDPNQMTLYIDVDNNSNSGNTIGQIGADFSYTFGERRGNLVINGTNRIVDHFDIGLVSLPSVSSNRFEIKINRLLKAGSQSIELSDQIRVILKDGGSNGDQLPDTEDGVIYSLSSFTQEIAPYSLSKENEEDLRFLSFNVERDAFFEFGTKAALQRIVKAVNPDIIAFQEIYDHNADQTMQEVESILNDPSQEWFSAKINPDIIVVSKYPIVDWTSIEGNGNGAFLIDVNGQEILLINLHLPCCDNNSGRVAEISNIVNFIADAKVNQATINIDENTPIFIMGDTNLVGNKSQIELLRNGFEQDLDWGTIMEDVKPLTTGEPLAISWYQPFSDFSPGRLDYILYSGSVLILKNSFIVFTPSMKNEELIEYNLELDDSTIGSDHLATVADFNFKSLTNINEASSNQKILIYPNPITSDENIYIDGIEEEIYSIYLYNNFGQIITSKIYTAGSQDSGINLNKLQEGIYFLSIKTGTRILTKKIIVTP